MGIRIRGAWGLSLAVISLTSSFAYADVKVPRLQLDVDRREAEKMQLGYGMVSSRKETRKFPDLLLAVDVPLPSFVPIRNLKSYTRITGQITYSPETDEARLELELTPVEKIVDYEDPDNLIDSEATSYLPISLKAKNGEVSVIDAGISAIGWQKRQTSRLKKFSASELDDFVRLAVEAVKVRYVRLNRSGSDDQFLVATPAVVKFNAGASWDSNCSPNKLVFEMGGVIGFDGAFALKNQQRNGLFTGVGNADLFARVRARVESALGEWELGLQTGVLIHSNKNDGSRLSSASFLIQGSSGPIRANPVTAESNWSRRC
ncbi:MAG TPA: hypothetical protein PLH57_09565, partial [Oligoflexia bacterium]|nr:hypothetical protein [Oligoflexia bacterium]